MNKILSATSSQQTIAIGESIGKTLKGGEVIELVSDLGGGKTTLAKGIVSGTGCKDLVSSPSFTLCNEYHSKHLTIYHFDFYRLNDPGIIRRELAEVAGQTSSVVIIEWPQVIEDILPIVRLIIDIKLTKTGSRKLKLTFPASLSYLAGDLE